MVIIQSEQVKLGQKKKEQNKESERKHDSNKKQDQSEVTWLDKKKCVW